MRLVNVDLPQGTRYPGFSTGAGPAARDIQKRMFQIAAHMRVPVGAYGSQFVRDEIERLLAECSAEDWDGDGAAPLAQTTASLALMFADALPLGLPNPVVEVGSLGEVTFEWRPARGRVLIVSIYADSTVGYAAVLGAGGEHGRYPFVGDVPPEVLQQLRAVLGF